MSIASRIVKRLRESRRGIPDSLKDIANELEDKVSDGVLNFLVSEGFPEEEAADYMRVNVTYSNEQLVVEVGAELGYNALSELCDSLNSIVSKYDKDSYFEPIDPGICGAWLNIESIVSESKDTLDVDDMRAELVKYGDFTEEEAQKLKGLDLAKAYSELPITVREGKEKRMEFATDSEAYEWADENGYVITNIQKGSHSNQSCIAWMRSMNEDTVYKSAPKKSVGEMKNIIDLIYQQNFNDYIEEFVLSHGVSSDSETIFDGLSDRDVETLYNLLYDKVVSHYGPDYEELNHETVRALGLDRNG